MPFDHPNVVKFDGTLRNLAEQFLEGSIAENGLLMKMSLQKLVMFGLEIRHRLWLKKEQYPSLQFEFEKSLFKQSSVEGMMAVSMSVSTFSTMEKSFSALVESQPDVPTTMILSPMKWKFVLRYYWTIEQMLYYYLITEVEEIFMSEEAPSEEITAQYRELLAIPKVLELLRQAVVYLGEAEAVIRNLVKFFPEHSTTLTGLFPYMKFE